MKRKKRKTRARPSLAQALATVRTALLELAATGPNGFEGLIQAIFGSITALEFRLLKSGFQGGGDLIAHTPTGPIVFEAKRYDKTANLEADVAGKVALAASHGRGKPSIWILGATIPLDPDTHSRLVKIGDEFNLDIAVLDWAGSLPRLAALVASDPPCVISFFKRVRKAQPSNRLLAALKAIRAAPRFTVLNKQILGGLTPSINAFRTLHNDSLQTHSAAMSDRGRARRQYGQALTPLASPEGRSEAMAVPRWDALGGVDTYRIHKTIAARVMTAR